MQPLEALKKYFGYSSFRPGQEEIVNAILSGKNTLAVLPTGAGKSLCYQLPVLISSGFSIVISPLIALMKDQVDNLNTQEATAAFINSSLSFQETERIVNNITFGKIKLLYVAPERLENPLFSERIKNLKPEYLFVDEAHCISEWGHNFRPSYRKITQFAEYTGIKKIAAFTATATPEVIRDIITQLRMGDAEVFVKGFERPNISVKVEVLKNKKERTAELIRTSGTPAIVYTASRKNAQEVAEFLMLRKIKAEFYHAGMPHDRRRQIQEDFLEDRLPVIAATNAFGMGIDKKDVRTVIHFNTPGTIENFYQEFGRAGRDGEPANAWLLYDDNDQKLQQFFINSSYPDKELIQKIYTALCDYGGVAIGSKSDKEIALNLDYLSVVTGRNMSRGLLNGALQRLQDAGYIRVISEYQKKTSVRFTVTPDQLKRYIKSTQDTTKKEAAMMLLREFGSKPFEKRINFDLNLLAGKAGLQPKEFEKALLGLDFSGLLDYDKPLGRESVVLPQPRIEATRLRLDYMQLNNNYLVAQQKLDRMVDFVFTSSCRFRYILDYFGQNVDGYECGRCDICTSEEAIPDRTVEYLTEIILSTVNEYQDGMKESQIVNTLLGKTRSQKLQKLSTYRSCVNFIPAELQTILHSLLNQQLLEKVPARRNRIFITQKGRDILLDAGLIEKKENTIEYQDQLRLFHELRDARKKIASRLGQKEQLICSDELLSLLSVKQPSTREELLEIEGISPRMANKIEKEFLPILTLSTPGERMLSDEPAVSELPQNLQETLRQIEDGMSLKEMAETRKLNEAVVSMQVEMLLQHLPETDITTVIGEEAWELIDASMLAGATGLKEIKAEMPEEISWGMIRIALAKKRALKET